MKKNIIGLSVLLGLFAYSENYTVIINQDFNKYEITDGFSLVAEYSEWVTTSNVCTDSLDPSTIYFGLSEASEEVCNDNQERTKTVKKVYDNGFEEVISTEKEKQKIETSRTPTTIIGTHKEDSCLNIQSFNSDLPDGQYSVFINNTEIHVLCDMITDGGGWTKVARIYPKGTHVVESNSWQSIENLTNDKGSHAIKYLNEMNPQHIMFKNTSAEDAYGKDDIVIVSRTQSQWNWTASSFNNNSDQNAKFYDASSSNWTSLGAATYASHDEGMSQSAALSFTINGIQNGYRAEYGNRLILNATFIDSSHSYGYWANFYGNPASTPYNNWADDSSNLNNGTGEIWMK